MAKEPLSGLIVSVILSMVSNTTISVLIAQRALAAFSWRHVPLVQRLVLMIYIDSYMFVFAAAVLQFGFNVDYSIGVCEAAIYSCLVCYVTTKVLIYLFLVEKAYIIRSKGRKPRLKSKLYVFNAFGMLGIYGVIVIMNFVYRIAYLKPDGQCIIGMAWLVMIPLIAFDLMINIYLTVLFLLPLSNLYSFKHMRQTRPSERLRRIAKRTFVGCICTLTSSIVNLTVLVALRGEPGWICLMCCNGDILFGAVVVHWITFKDNGGSTNRDSHSQPWLRSNVGSRALGHAISVQSTVCRQADDGKDWSPGQVSHDSRPEKTQAGVASLEEVECEHAEERPEGRGRNTYPSSQRPCEADEPTRPPSALHSSEVRIHMSAGSGPNPTGVGHDNRPRSLTGHAMEIGSVDGIPTCGKSHGGTGSSSRGHWRRFAVGRPGNASY